MWDYYPYKDHTVQGRDISIKNLYSMIHANSTFELNVKWNIFSRMIWVYQLNNYMENSILHVFPNIPPNTFEGTCTALGVHNVSGTLFLVPT